MLALLDQGEVNLALKFSGFIHHDTLENILNEESLIAAGDAAFRNGWIHQGILGYCRAGEMK
jgi:hypothetical protein